VRFDLEKALKQVPNYKLIFSGPGNNRFHDKFLRKANDFWQMTTGTYNKSTHASQQSHTVKQFTRKKTTRKIKKKGDEEEKKSKMRKKSLTQTDFKDISPQQDHKKSS